MGDFSPVDPPHEIEFFKSQANVPRQTKSTEQAFSKTAQTVKLRDNFVEKSYLVTARRLSGNIKGTVGSFL